MRIRPFRNVVEAFVKGMARGRERRPLRHGARVLLRFARLGLASLAVGMGLAQTLPTPIQVGVQPPPSTVMITQTVHTVSLTVVRPELYTNLAAALLVEADVSNLLDDGIAPDANAGDGEFNGNLLVPAYPANTNFTVRFTAWGQDLAVTNEAGELLAESWVTNATDVTYEAVVRTGNDDFSRAFKLPPEGGIATGTNSLATIEPAEPFHGDDPDVAASLWWTWSPTHDTRVLMDTAGSSFPPVLAVYTGASLAGLRPVAASTNDVAHGLKANVVFGAIAGVTYRIAVAGYNAEGTGGIRLSVVPGGLPDTVAPSVNILFPPSDSLLTTNDVTLSGTTEDPAPDATGVTQVEVRLNDDSPVVASGTTNWTLALRLRPGTNVVTALARDLAGNVSLPSTVRVRYTMAGNDNFAEAIALTGLAGTVRLQTDMATKEVGEPPHAGNEGGHSIWYQYEAPAGGSLRLSTRESSFDTLLAVYQGDSVTNLTLIGANDDAAPGSGYSELTVLLRRGQVYAIAVDGFGEAFGLVSLEHAFAAEETLYSLTVLPVLGGTVAPGSGWHPEGSTQVVTALPARDFEFLGWQGSVSSAQNPLMLVMTQDHSLSATFRLTRCTDGFESGGFSGPLAWASSGAVPWQVQSDGVDTGQFAARSGPISDGQASVLFLRTELLRGTAAFRLRVSAEDGWDGLEFYLNGRQLQRWTGEVDWESYEFAVHGGVATLEWRFVKDANFSVGLDAAFLDNVYLPLPDPTLAPRLTLMELPGMGCQIAVQGYPGRACVIEASPDLAFWEPRQTNSVPGGSWVWVDPESPLLDTLFYRAIQW